jgi:hypothetical protein
MVIFPYQLPTIEPQTDFHVEPINTYISTGKNLDAKHINRVDIPAVD